MLEKLISRIKQKILIKNLLNLILLLLPLITFSILQFGYSLLWIIPLILVIILHITHNVKKYNNTTHIDKTLKLNNAISTYYEYRYSNNPFISKLAAEAQNVLKNANPPIFPKFEIISLPIILSLFIISIYISHQKASNPNPNTLNYQKNPDIHTYKSSNSFVTKNTNKRRNSYKYRPIPLYTDSNIKPFKQSNDTKQKNVSIPIRNNISKKEKGIIEAIINESHYGR